MSWRDLDQKQDWGVWCNYGGDGAVLMIGGRGVDCRPADHGIGVTEANEASFVHYGDLSGIKFDFGNHLNAENPPTSSYSLDIYVR